MKTVNLAVLIAIFGILVLLSGCPQQPSGMVTQSTETVPEPVGPQLCPFECCLSVDYLTKQCQGENLECVNQQCVKKECPFQCCAGVQYQAKYCQQDTLECIENQCVRKACPYECCNGETYQLKSCQADYECLTHVCQPKDSDGDGLTDVEEKQIGTNVGLVDSDTDGLNDFIEVRQKGTDPLNANTDADRYNDGEDSEPLTVNSAAVVITPTNSKTEMNWLVFGPLLLALGDMYFTGGTLVAVFEGLGLHYLTNSVLATYTVDYDVKNEGTDYTEYVKFDAVIYLCKSSSDMTDAELIREQKEFGRLEPGQESEGDLSYDAKATMFTENATEVFLQGYHKGCYKFENITYEKYT